MADFFAQLADEALRRLRGPGVAPAREPASGAVVPRSAARAAALRRPPVPNRGVQSAAPAAPQPSRLPGGARVPASIDPFAEAATAQAAFAEPPEPPNPLLGAFSGRPGLLAGIVLAEALAPPLALQPFEERRR